MVRRTSNYWRKRQNKQLGRFGRKAYGVISSPSVGTVARAAWSGVKYLRSLVNSETFYNSFLGTDSILNTGVVHNLNLIGQGDTQSTRTGNSILLRHLSLDYNFKKNSSATNTFVKFAIVMDKQQVSDTTPSFTDVFESANPNAKLNLNNLGRFKLLKHFVFNLSTARDYKNVKLFFKLNKYHMRFNGTSTTDIQKNGIYIMMSSDEATNTPSINYSYRLSYHDN